MVAWYVYIPEETFECGTFLSTWYFSDCNSFCITIHRKWSCLLIVSSTKPMTPDKCHCQEISIIGNPTRGYSIDFILDLFRHFFPLIGIGFGTSLFFCYAGISGVRTQDAVKKDDLFSSLVVISPKLFLAVVLWSRLLTELYSIWCAWYVLSN